MNIAIDNCGSNTETRIDITDRSPEFQQMLQEYMDIQAQLLAPPGCSIDEAWAYIKFHNLMDRISCPADVNTLH